jgi:hypothetical protein
MITELGRFDPPEWLMADEFIFDIREIIKDSMFYPRSRLDTEPINYLFGNVYSFIYADYGLENSYQEAFTNNIFIDFEIIHRESISHEAFNLFDEEYLYGFPNDVQLEDFKYGIFDMYNHPFRLKKELSSIYDIEKPKQHPFHCEWYIFQNSCGRRFSLLYFESEPMLVYQTIYYLNKYAPKIVMLMYPEELEEFEEPAYWSDYTNEEGYFGQLTTKQHFRGDDYVMIPEYTVISIGVAPWGMYPKFIYHDRRIAIWGKELSRRFED